MEIDEKLRLINGKDFWTTYSNGKHGIGEIVFSDGPTGLRFQPGENDHLGMNDSCEATCFPTSSALSCSWDPELIESVAACIAAEAADKGVDVVLGPGVNIKRSPLCGRNFEYYSEDPFLSGTLGTAFVKGLQNNGAGASLKHFAANNQEAYRMTVNAVVDERALFEVYLKAFEMVVKDAGPWTVMSAYNRLRGEFCSENKWLLTDVLRKRWNYDGLVISDWYAVNDIVKSVNSGLDLEMPSVGDLSFNLLKAAYNSGELDKEAVDRAVQNILKLEAKCRKKQEERKEERLTGRHGERLAENKAAVHTGTGICLKSTTIDLDRHHEIARKAAADSMVLLKNNCGNLPLKPGSNILFVGELMKEPIIQGNGSSRVNPVKVDSIQSELEAAGCSYKYEAGYRLNDARPYEELVCSAIEAAREAEKIVVFAGLFNFNEAEGYDREDLKLPECQNYLIKRLSETGRKITVVLQTGSAVEMPWVDSVDSVLQMHLAGQGAGKALVDVLYGRVNPSGKLTETYPCRLEHIPSYLHRGNSTEVVYGESIFTGYKYYDKKKLDVLFPFGYGLSYTEFSYSSLNIARSGSSFNVQFDLENTGSREGVEIAQVYACLNEAVEIQPVRKLAGFRKIALKPGEKKTVSIAIPVDTFTYYSPEQKDFVYTTGYNSIEVGKSSRDIVLKGTVEIKENNRKYRKITIHTTVGELLEMPELKDIVEEQLDALIAQLGSGDGNSGSGSGGGSECISGGSDSGCEGGSGISSYSECISGGSSIDCECISGGTEDSAESPVSTSGIHINMEGAINKKELEKAIYYLPLKNIVQISNGSFSYDNLLDFIGLLNDVISHKLIE